MIARQSALAATGATMMMEAIYEKVNGGNTCDRDIRLLHDLHFLFCTIGLRENILWTEDVSKDNNCWCMMSVPYKLYDDEVSKITISLDGKEGNGYMLGSVSVTVDGKEVLNGIRYVKV